jgi:hypothetical protein
MALAGRRRSLTEHAAPGGQDARGPREGDYDFFGYEGLMSQMRQQMRRVEIRGGTPSASVIEQYVYVPMDQTGLQRRQRGALASEPAAGSAVQPEAEIDEDVVYLGWLFNHYGHFLMQSLARVWFLAEVNPATRVLFHHPSAPRFQPTGWARRMLEAFGVPPERMLTLREPTRLRRLIVPEPLFEPRATANDQTVRVHEAMARPYWEVARRIAGNVEPSPQPLYLSRRRLPSTQRAIIGEDWLEDVLRQNGFRIAYPERMSFEEQVRLLNSHPHIVSNAGSAAQNVLFARHAPALHLLTNGSQFSPDYFMHHTVVGTPTTFINCLGLNGRANFPKARKQTPHLLDTMMIADYLAQRGFLTHPIPAMPADLIAQHDEAWLYGYIQEIGQRAPLPPAVENEATALAPTSWPVSLALARYHAQREPARVENLARHFAALAAAERNEGRVHRYCGEVPEMARVIARRCRPETASRVRAVVADRFQPDRVGNG